MYEDQTLNAATASSHSRVASAQSKLPSSLTRKWRNSPRLAPSAKRFQPPRLRTMPLESTAASSENDESEAMRACALACGRAMGERPTCPSGSGWKHIIGNGQRAAGGKRQEAGNLPFEPQSPLPCAEGFAQGQCPGAFEPPTRPPTPLQRAPRVAHASSPRSRAASCETRTRHAQPMRVRGTPADSAVSACLPHAAALLGTYRQPGSLTRAPLRTSST